MEGNTRGGEWVGGDRGRDNRLRNTGGVTGDRSEAPFIGDAPPRAGKRTCNLLLLAVQFDLDPVGRSERLRMRE